jgi:hypothetical protein
MIGGMSMGGAAMNGGGMSMGAGNGGGVSMGSMGGMGAANGGLMPHLSTSGRGGVPAASPVGMGSMNMIMGGNGQAQTNGMNGGWEIVVDRWVGGSDGSSHVAP